MSDTWNKMLLEEDYPARMETLVEIIRHEFENDDEHWSKKGRYIARALAANDANQLLVALCGWTAESLAVKSFMLCDEHEEFDNQDEHGVFIARWSDGVKTEWSCMISAITHEVTGIEKAIHRENDGVSIVEAYVQFAPVSDWAEFYCIPECKRGDNKVCFWYKEV